MKLGAFFNPTGHHVASWRHPDAAADAGINFPHYVEIARTAERGKFHFIFLADMAGMRRGRMEAVSRSAQYVANFEPLTLLSALAAVTSRIGLIATATTSYHEPYHVARMFASLDHISGGRAGWNVVTSASGVEATNFGRDEHFAHGERYERAREFCDVVLGLWDSWDDDAFLRDKASGLFFDPAKLHRLDHAGRHFRVSGPLNVPRPPQGHPVIVQAGSSDAGLAFAADYAEIVFSIMQDLQDGQRLYAALKRRARERGRSPDAISIMPGLCPIVGRTEAEAAARHAALQELIHPVVGREFLSMMLGGADLSGCDIDGPLPDLPETNASKGAFKVVMDLARREDLTIRQLYFRLAGARGQRTLVGTAGQIADEMEQWVRSGAADGFNIMPAYLPGGLDDFVEQVIPELQRRGLFRREYSGTTLRENLGLERPVSRRPTMAEAPG